VGKIKVKKHVGKNSMWVKKCIKFENRIWVKQDMGKTGYG
jgi:thiamine pyrophosphate-dependent acetolactate synthase large subunit-like protein